MLDGSLKLDGVYELLAEIFQNPLASLLVIGNLIVIESLLSVDNAAVLATMVLDLPSHQRDRALRYGIIGAYVFRGLCLLFAAYLIQIWWLKPLGGIYLLWLAFDHFKPYLGGERGNLALRVLTLLAFLFLVEANAPLHLGALAFDAFDWLVRPLLGLLALFFLYSLIQVPGDEADDGQLNHSNNAVYQFFFHRLGRFWSTIILVEIMDLAFSIDNVFAAVAYSRNIILVCLGVFIGILAMRFVAQWFVRLLEKYPFLETCAFLVIALLGAKLSLSLYTHAQPCSLLARWMEGSHECLRLQGQTAPTGQHEFVPGDVATSLLTLAIFLVPLAYTRWRQAR